MLRIFAGGMYEGTAASSAYRLAVMNLRCLAVGGRHLVSLSFRTVSLDSTLLVAEVGFEV